MLIGGAHEWPLSSWSPPDDEPALGASSGPEHALSARQAAAAAAAASAIPPRRAGVGSAGTALYMTSSHVGWRSPTQTRRRAAGVPRLRIGAIYGCGSGHNRR